MVNHLVRQGNDDDDHCRGGSPINIMISQQRRDGESSGETGESYIGKD